jgi:hypothetical protein
MGQEEGKGKGKGQKKGHAGERPTITGRWPQTVGKLAIASRSPVRAQLPVV